MLEHRLFHESSWIALSCEHLLGELPLFMLRAWSTIVVDLLLVFCLLGIAPWQGAGRSAEKKIVYAFWPAQKMRRCVEIKHTKDRLRWWQ